MDWDKLRVFRIIAEAGSFTHGAEQLNLSQSAVSRQIKSLEEDMGVSLFNRHARGLVMTSEGEVLLSTVRSVFTQLETTKDLLSESSDKTEGTVRLAVTHAFGPLWLAPRVHLFNKRYPDIHLHIVLTDDEVDFSMREADIAVSFREANQPSLIKHHLLDFEIVPCASQAYLDEMGTPKTVEDLDEHRIIAFGDDMPAPLSGVNWLLNTGLPPGRVRKPYLILPNAHGIIQTVRSGLGVAAIASYILPDFSDDIVRLLPNVKPPSARAHVQYPEQLNNSPRVEAVRDFLLETMRP